MVVTLPPFGQHFVWIASSYLFAMTRSDDKSRVLHPLNHKLFQSGEQNFLQLLFVLRRGLREEEAPDAHRGVHNVAGFQHAVEVLLDGLKI